jgi:hypothetical protein
MHADYRPGMMNMKRKIFFAVPLVFTVISASAGTLENGTWRPDGCGPVPETPAIVSSSADAFNQSIAAVNEWREKLRAFDECMINEANQDGAAIAEAAKAHQQRYQDASARLSDELAAARDQFEGKSMSNGAGGVGGTGGGAGIGPQGWPGGGGSMP